MGDKAMRLSRLVLWCAGLMAAATSAMPATAKVAAKTPAVPALCAIAKPCAHPLPVRVVIVAMFEIGKDTGDVPGEFQLWKERQHLDMRIPLPHSFHDLYYNPKTQVLGMVTGVGSIRSAAALMAVGLDQRIDVSRAYWLIAGIAGIDPHNASIGSAAWARWLVDGDLGHEIDAREIPKDWPDGYFGRGQKGPNDRSPPRQGQGEVFELNPALANWAYNLTKDTPLPDSPSIAAERARYTGFPEAQRPPFVLMGDQLSALTFWHGKLMTDWANRWVNYWTEGKGDFVTSAMEETGSFQSIEYLSKIGRADRDRVMVLRTGSNYTMPPPGVSAADYLLRENEGYAGLGVAVDSLYRVGVRVVDELLAHWPQYEKTTPR